MFEWTAHRFSGGLLALDLANTVVWHDLADKRTDRLTQLAEVGPFTLAANQFRRAEVEGASLVAPSSPREFHALLDLRAAINTWMRAVIAGNAEKAKLGPLFAACAKATHHDIPHSLTAACACSTMRLLDPVLRVRVKICPTCHWLFVDRSKNQSRHWCDMKVCGNRAKARKHYHRLKEITS